MSLDLEYFAAALAMWMHRDQVDKQGEPYWLHLKRVAERVEHHGDEIVAIAWLHDILEDTVMELDILSDYLRLPDRVVSGVHKMTHFPWKSYQEYIDIIADNRDTAIVKLADLEDNMDESRGPIPGNLKKRYEKAHAFLMQKWGGEFK